MDLNGIPLFKALRQQMNFLTARQDVISSNVANADTPGYQARDLKQPRFDDVMASFTSDSAAGGGHIKHAGSAPTGLGEKERYESERINGWETTPDGNSVTLEEEMLRMSETQIAFRTATNIYRKSLSMIKIAIGKS